MLDTILGQIDTLRLDELRQLDAAIHELIDRIASWQSAEPAGPARAEPAITYRQETVRCGKERCKRCAGGQGHGPYWYAYWSEGGRTRSKYIGKTLPKTEASTPIAQAAPAAELRPAEQLRRITVWLRPNSKKRHLSIDGKLTLCGLTLAESDLMPLGIFQYDDCTNCRRQAQLTGLACEGCGAPLLKEASPGRCYACSKTG